MKSKTVRLIVPEVREYEKDKDGKIRAIGKVVQKGKVICREVSWNDYEFDKKYSQSSIDKALQKQREQLIKQIENKDLPKGGVYTPQYMKDYAEGYNACLQEVLQILNR